MAFYLWTAAAWFAAIAAGRRAKRGDLCWAAVLFVTAVGEIVAAAHHIHY